VTRTLYCMCYEQQITKLQKKAKQTLLVPVLAARDGDAHGCKRLYIYIYIYIYYVPNGNAFASPAHDVFP
jgi:hypothetical protein